MRDSEVILHGEMSHHSPDWRSTLTLRAKQELGGPVLGSEDLSLLSPLRDSKVGSLSRVVSGPGGLPGFCRDSLHPRLLPRTSQAVWIRTCILLMLAQLNSGS